MKSFPFFRRSIALALMAVPLLAGVSAAADDAYPHRIDPSVLKSAETGPHASLYFRRDIPVLFRSDQSVNILNLSSANASVLMLGKYHGPSGSVDLELRGALRSGTLEIHFPLGQLDAALYEWEESFAQPAGLEGLEPNVRSLTFQDPAGFRAIYGVKRDFEYQLTVDVPYNHKTRSLEDARPPYQAAADFIRWLEKDDRSRTILEAGSLSGLPVFVSAGEDADTLAAGFLQNTIRYNARTGARVFAYDAPLSRLSRLPEVRRLVKDPAVAAFLEGPGDVHVRASGSEADGFVFSVSKEGGRRLEATLVGKKVSVKP